MTCSFNNYKSKITLVVGAGAPTDSKGSTGGGTGWGRTRLTGEGWGVMEVGEGMPSTNDLHQILSPIIAASKLPFSYTFTTYAFAVSEESVKMRK